MSRRIPLIIALLLPVAVIALMIFRDTGDTAPVDVTLIRAFPQLTDADLQTVHLYDTAAPQDGFVMTRTANGPWRIPGDGQPLDVEKVEVMAALIAQLEFHDVIESGDLDYAEHGLVGEGGFVIEFITHDGAAHRVYIGNLRESELAYSVRIDEDLRVFIMQRAQIDLLKNWYLQPPFAE